MRKKKDWQNKVCKNKKVSCNLLAGSLMWCYIIKYIAMLSICLYFAHIRHRFAHLDSGDEYLVHSNSF